MRTGQLRLTPEQVDEINSLRGKKSCMEVGRMFGIDHASVLYHWKRISQTRKTRKFAAEQVYQKMLKAYQKKIFIRDEVGNLVKILSRNPPLSTFGKNMV